MSYKKMLFVVGASLALAACDKVKNAAKSLEDSLFEEPAYEAVPGEPAAGYFHGAPGAAPVDTAALSQAIDAAGTESMALAMALTEDEQSIPEVDGKTIDLLVSGADAKAALKTGTFAKPPVATLLKEKEITNMGLNLVEIPEKPIDYDPKMDAVRLDDASWGGKTEIVISNLDKVAIKDQQSRGTCAAFTGVSYLEYLTLKKFGGQVPSVDLSEQRFYMMAKPDHWETGGVTDQDGGSSWASGNRTSFGEGGVTSPTDNAPFNIPLEKDCPYNGQPGANEIQVPQAATCRRGAVRVTNLTETYRAKSGNEPWKLYSNAPRSAQEIFDYIKTNDLPVPVGTTLTGNWEDNDGMITSAGSKLPGVSGHAGGHAYLIVGMRKLDEAKYPGEGGMCFIIRNSWGAGWGVGGFACMTLAWFNEARDAYAFDVALDVEADVDYLKANAVNGVPATLALPDGPVAPVTSTPALEPQPVLTPTADPGAPAGGNAVAAGGGTPAPAPLPTTPDGYVIAKLLTKDGKLVQALYKRDGDKLLVRGVYQGQTAATHNLELAMDGDEIIADDEQHKKEKVKVGRIDGENLTLCSGAYALTCHLNILKDENKLVIGVTEAEFRNYEPNVDADYKSLVSFKNYGIDFALGDGVFSDFRFTVGGKLTNPIRLAVKPVSGDILYRGKVIGNYQKLTFCSGDFKSVCRVLFNKKDASIKILFKAQKNG